MALLPSPVTLASVLAIAAPALYLLQHYLRTQTIFKETVLPDLVNLGTPGDRKHGTVVICGGSMAGLFAARTCSNHFDRVIVIEAEGWALSDEARHSFGYIGTRHVQTQDGEFETVTHKRTRIWQYTTFHGFQRLLINILRKLYPDFDTRAEKYGIVIAPASLGGYLNGRYIRMPYKNGKHLGETSPLRIHCSRAALETTVRSLTAEHAPQVEYIHGTVTGLKLSDDSSTVTAVTVRLVDSNQVVDFACDMIIDCTGVAQAGLKWLTRALPPAKAAKLANIRHEYNPNLTYSSFDMPAPPSFDEELDKLLLVNPAKPGESHQLGKFHWLMFWGNTPDIDGINIFLGRDLKGRVILVTGGWDAAMPVTLDAVRGYALTARIKLPNWFFRVLELLEPVKNEVTCTAQKLTSCSRIWYEKVDVLPLNFIANGDSVLRLNPRNGEGITKAAIGTATLDGLLRRLPKGPRDPSFNKSFFKLLDSRIGHLWDASRYLDYGNPTSVPIEGETLNDGAFVRWIVPRLIRLAETDDSVAETFVLCDDLLAPNSDLATIPILLKILWQEYVTRAK